MARKVPGVEVLSKVCNTMTDTCKTNAAIDRKLEDVTGKPLTSLDTIQCTTAIKNHEQDYATTTSQAQTRPQPFKHHVESDAQALLQSN